MGGIRYELDLPTRILRGADPGGPEAKFSRGFYREIVKDAELGFEMFPWSQGSLGLRLGHSAAVHVLVNFVRESNWVSHGGGTSVARDAPEAHIATSGFLMPHVPIPPTCPPSDCAWGIVAECDYNGGSHGTLERPWHR